MASDSLNQIGRYIKKTRIDTDFALKRYSNQLPQIERSRDIFDSVVPYEMEFTTIEDSMDISMDLYFNKPPPFNGCISGCLRGICETYVVEDNGLQLFTTEFPYLVGTMRVFRQDEIAPSGTTYEESPTAGRIWVDVDTPNEPKFVSFCYVTNWDDCENDCGFTWTTTGFTQIWGVGSWGVNKTWGFTQPDDGRIYATTWGTSTINNTSLTTPRYSVGMAWGLFGDPGPGAPRSATQTVVNALTNINPTGLVSLTLTGDIRLNIDGNPTGGGTGLATATVAINTYVMGTALPSVHDYGIDGPTLQETFVLTADASEASEWTPFNIVLGTDGLSGPHEIGGPRILFQWGVEIANAFTILAAAGPLSAGTLLPNTGTLSVGIRNAELTIQCIDPNGTSV